MRQLYIVRHGVAQAHGTPGIPDDERTLTDKGIRKMRRVARGLNRLRVRPDRIYSSPLPRARQTAEIVASSTRCADRLTFAEELRPGASAVDLLIWLRSLPEEKVMIVGHNPTLQELIGLLIVGEESDTPPRLGELRKGEVVLFTSNPEGQLQLDWAAPPRLLRRLGD